MDPFVDEILAAKFVYLEDEVYKEFQDCCERATGYDRIVPGDLRGR